MKSRCSWSATDPLYLKYHDTEWGLPLHNDRRLFEFLILEGAQAGLSWITILKKRQNYRKAFDDFNPHKIAKYDTRKVSELLSNEGIVRNKLKINAAIQNAISFLAVQREFGSFNRYIWQFVGGGTIKNKWKSLGEIPAQKRGFKFVGPTICYAFMQASGLVNDHVVDCFRYEEV